VLHVGLNLVYLVPGETGGMEVYARELLPRLAELDGLRLTAFVNREAAAQPGGPWGELVPAVVVPVDARSRVARVRAEQTWLPGLARRAGIDVLHSLASTAPLWGPFARVTTVHDLIYARFPEAHFGLMAAGLRVLVPLGARRAHRLVVDSASTRDDLVALVGVSPSRVEVVPLAASAPRSAPTPEAELRERLGLGARRVVLTASAKRPHKNLLRLLDAHARLPAAGRPALVLPGYPTEHDADLRRRAAELGTGDEVRVTGWLPDADLEGLFALAALFAFPSLYEGFGLPVLEAMQRGVPVACSDRTSLPEVVGEAALLFDPEDAAAIAAALERLLTDDALAGRLRAAGRERARRFTWEATARGTAEAYRRALAAA
jgi:glycosyltransferase involved in cell wall biosynthesis